VDGERELAFRSWLNITRDHVELEQGQEKIAIYARDGEPTHAARQLEDGSWTSKLGPSVDISHAATSAVEGSLYGAVVRYMRRVRSK
jgi:hypothetical protein